MRFSTIAGVKEDVITLLLNLKKIRIKMLTDEPQTLTIHAKGIGEVTAGNIEAVGQIEILNPDLVIAHITEKSTDLSIEMVVERGMGYVSRASFTKESRRCGSYFFGRYFYSDSTRQL